MSDFPENIKKEPHLPDLLKNDEDYNRIKTDVLKGIKGGLDIKESFVFAGIGIPTYYKWRQWYVEGLEYGIRKGKLYTLMTAAAKADVNLHLELRKMMFKKAREGDTRMMMYLEDNRFGAVNKRKNTFDLGANSGNNIQINIVPMEQLKIDEEAEEDYVEIDVNGTSRDDSDSAEMD